MHGFRPFSTAFIILLITGHNPGITNQSRDHVDKRFFLADNRLASTNCAGCDMYILLSGEGISKKEEQAIKVRDFKRVGKTGDFSIKLDNNQQIVLANQKVWGYQDRDCHIYRNFNNDFLRMEQNASLVIYAGSAIGFRGKLITYYFSKTLEGTVLRLDRNNIAEQFKDNACFLGNVIKRLGCPGDFADWDNKKSSFVIVEILNQCQ